MQDNVGDPDLRREVRILTGRKFKSWGRSSNLDSVYADGHSGSELLELFLRGVLFTILVGLKGLCAISTTPLYIVDPSSWRAPT